MTTTIIIICVLLLFAYIFDISAAKTKIPSVILLLTLGYVAKLFANFLEVDIPNLDNTLPILGTVGLILIVLEGSLELDVNRSKMKLIGQTTAMSLIPLFIFSFGFAYYLNHYQDIPYKIALVNAIPLSIISSSIAIPSVHHLTSYNKEFITYESSLSDIFGVVFFNFVALNEVINAQTYQRFGIQIIIMLLVTFITTLGLAYLLSKIKHHVKYAPIILMTVLIYTVAKDYHLPSLLFILLFGIFLGNLDEMKDNKYIKKLRPEILTKEVQKFKELTTEIAFLIRAVFFLLFGYLIETRELLNYRTVLWAIGICLVLFVLRSIFLLILRISWMPIAFIFPRGLITILLFLSIPEQYSLDIINKSLIIQIIILSALIMMTGLMSNKTVDVVPEKVKIAEDNSTEDKKEEEEDKI
ncbi:MAG TPA: cation:proton antiporter [Chitinophagales bacterium]|nr:cation:proton antiporter [Chitinophagales bacterium]